MYIMHMLKCICVFILSYNFVLACKSNYKSQDRGYCRNESVTCKSQLENFPNASDADCMIEAPGACSTWEFSGGSSSHPLSVKLVPLARCENSLRFTVMKLLLKDIEWTSLQFRFTEYQNEHRTFCRRFRLSSEYDIPELVYDCRWTDDHDHYKTFIFQYEAQRASHREAGKYWFRLPGYSELDLTYKSDLTQWTPFLYIDVSESPSLTVRWQQAPLNFGVRKYELKVYDRNELKETKVFSSTDEEELNYKYSEYFPTYGEYKFEVRVLHDSCKNGVCPVSQSPEIVVGDSSKKALAVGIFGCIVVLCLLFIILYSWKRLKQPEGIKQPKLLIIYSASNASHIRVVEELAKYLRKCCFVDALLDLLDIPKTKKKDPYEWYNDAFVHLDFVMVVSSPPKCCNQEGLYRGADVIALRFLKSKFSDHKSRCQFFSVLLPYCTEQDIPNDAKHFVKFKLTKDLDKMLWFVRNGGKFPTFLDSACALLGPNLPGGESDLKVSGVNLLKYIKEAEGDSFKCHNHKNVREEEISKNKTTGLQSLIQLSQVVTESSPKYVEQSRDVSEMNSDAVMNYEDFMEVSLNDLDLTGARALDPELLNKQRTGTQAAYDLDTLAL